LLWRQAHLNARSRCAITTQLTIIENTKPATRRAPRDCSFFSHYYFFKRMDFHKLCAIVRL
jgi:hypothetical protein